VVDAEGGWGSRAGPVISGGAGCLGGGPEARGDEGLAARLLLDAEVAWRMRIGAPRPNLLKLGGYGGPSWAAGWPGAARLVSASRGRGEPWCKDGDTTLIGPGVVSLRLRYGGRLA
jgi:hypothetical protein